MKDKIINYIKSLIDKLFLLIYDKVRFFEEKDVLENESHIFIKIFKWSSLILIGVISLFLWSCSSVPLVQYYPVNVPVKCEISKPLKPLWDEDVYKSNLNITKYAEELETALNVCIKGAD